MESASPVAVAEAWIAAWSGVEPAAVGAGVGASPLDWELPREQPSLCLAAIVAVLERIDGSAPNRLLAVLAAGPLEDLLVYNGAAVVDEVELLARRSPEFRRLLNGVWNSTIPAEVLARLAKYRDQPW